MKFVKRRKSSRNCDLQKKLWKGGNLEGLKEKWFYNLTLVVATWATLCP